jgi:hypothetical protein
LPYHPQSPEGLAARWVRWVAGIGPVSSPVADTTGEHAATDQPGDVWFLAGTFGEMVHRRCTTPAGVPLFLPAVNVWWWPTDQRAEGMPDAFGRVSVDGAAVELQTVATGPFDVAGARFNPVTRTRKVVPVAVWGLWATVAGLEPGRHEVQVEGGDGHGFRVDALYTLEVGPTSP